MTKMAEDKKIVFPEGGNGRRRGKAKDEAGYLLRLYVAGTTPRSASAIANVKEICDEYLAGSYELDVVDIYQQPKLAKGEQIIAAPTLIKKLPLPLRRIIGDMSDKERFLVGLDIQPKK
ncbi:MAG: circadian clock KaiB family protein [Smithellaceae bacterium]|nr:circadian clock KaiB family protein [Smithellaceae bacterium]